MKFLILLISAVSVALLAANQGWQPGQIFDVPSLTSNSVTYAGSNGKLSSTAVPSTSTPQTLTQTTGNAPAFNGNYTAPVPLPNAKFVNIYQGNLPIGTTDLYTVPAGRRAVVTTEMVANVALGAAVTLYNAIKISGTYYEVTAATSFGSNTSGANGSFSIPIMLNAGESISAVTATTAGLNLWATVIEFDNTAAINVHRLLTVAVGDNTLYTVPSGKTAVVLNSAFNFPGAATVNLNYGGVIGYMNVSGATVTRHVNVVPNGGTPSNANTSVISATITNGTLLTLPVDSTLGPGDFISINTSSATAGQNIYVNVVEF